MYKLRAVFGRIKLSIFHSTVMVISTARSFNTSDQFRRWPLSIQYKHHGLFLKLTIQLSKLRAYTCNGTNSASCKNTNAHLRNRRCGYIIKSRRVSIIGSFDCIILHWFRCNWHKRPNYLMLIVPVYCTFQMHTFSSVYIHSTNVLFCRIVLPSAVILLLDYINKYITYFIMNAPPPPNKIFSLKLDFFHVNIVFSLLLHLIWLVFLKGFVFFLKLLLKYNQFIILLNCFGFHSNE